MPIFMILGHDRADSAGLRAETRPRHLAYVEQIRPAIVRGGPFLDEAGVPLGSMILAEFDDLAAARAWAERDPYAEVGLFESVTVAAWRHVFP